MARSSPSASRRRRLLVAVLSAASPRGFADASDALPAECDLRLLAPPARPTAAASSSPAARAPASRATPVTRLRRVGGGRGPSRRGDPRAVQRPLRGHRRLQRSARTGRPQSAAPARHTRRSGAPGASLPRPVDRRGRRPLPPGVGALHAGAERLGRCRRAGELLGRRPRDHRRRRAARRPGPGAVHAAGLPLDLRRRRRAGDRGSRSSVGRARPGRADDHGRPATSTPTGRSGRRGRGDLLRRVPRRGGALAPGRRRRHGQDAAAIDARRHRAHRPLTARNRRSA